MLSAERATARVWLLQYWPKASKAQALLREIGEVFERKVLGRSDTLVLADLARFCNAGDTSLDENPLRMAANEGRREVWLHLKAMYGLGEDDVNSLLERTE